MRALSHVAAACELAKALGKPVLYINHSGGYDPDPDRYLAAAPYLRNVDATLQIMADGCGFIVCENEEELERLYELTVGDDGPTKTNPYDGPERFYALTIDANGQPHNENT